MNVWKHSKCSKNELNRVKKFNTQLEMRLNQLKGLEQELNNIKKNNKELSITLAKSELEFSKKHKEELKKEEERLSLERIAIEDNAQLLAEKNAKNKYMTIIIPLIFIFMVFMILSFFKRKEYSKKILDKETNIEQMNKLITELNKKVEDSTKLINSLEFKIKETEMRVKEGDLNHVVRKIDENQRERTNLLKHIEKDLING